MKILYHHRTLGDGAEGIHIAAMVAAFRALGHDVQILGLAAADRPGRRRSWISRLRAAMPATVFELASAAGNVVEYLEVRRALRSGRPDFVYKRHARNDVATLMAARRAGVPAVLEVNCLFTGADYRQFEPIALHGLTEALEKRALALASVTVAVSTPLAAEIAQLSGVRAEVMANGVDGTLFDPARVDPALIRTRYALGSAFVIGWSGVLREWHGLELLLEALTRIPDARLLIVGDGPARSTVEALASARGLTERVVITGRIPHEEMPGHLASVDAAVVAHDRTGVASPMKLLEYMAMAKPVVAPRLDNIRDVVADGYNGLLFTPGDADDLARILASLGADGTLRARLGSAARATIDSTCNWMSNARRVIELVQNQTADRAIVRT